MTTEYRRLKRAGFDVNSTPTFAFNDGSETPKHAVSKLFTAMCVQSSHWDTDIEVSCERGGVDVIAYAEDRLNYAIELENNPKPQVRETKLAKYVYSNNVIDDLILVDITDAPTEMNQLMEFLRGQLDLW